MIAPQEVDVAERLSMLTAIAMFVCLFAGGACGYLSGFQAGRDAEKRQAISADVAEWHVNPKTGQTEFRYKR